MKRSDGNVRLVGRDGCYAFRVDAPSPAVNFICKHASQISNNTWIISQLVWERLYGIVIRVELSDNAPNFSEAVLIDTLTHKALSWSDVFACITEHALAAETATSLYRAGNAYVRVSVSTHDILIMFNELALVNAVVSDNITFTLFDYIFITDLEGTYCLPDEVQPTLGLNPCCTDTLKEWVKLNNHSLCRDDFDVLKSTHIVVPTDLDLRNRKFTRTSSDTEVDFAGVLADALAFNESGYNTYKSDGDTIVVDSSIRKDGRYIVFTCRGAHANIGGTIQKLEFNPPSADRAVTLLSVMSHTLLYGSVAVMVGSVLIGIASVNPALAAIATLFTLCILRRV